MQKYCSQCNDACSSLVYQSMDVALPISLTPDVNVGKMEIRCCGEPKVTIQQNNFGNCRCEIMVTQTISYRIPIEYSILMNAGETVTDCMKSQCYQQ